MPELKCENPTCQCKTLTDAVNPYCSDFCRENAINAAKCECGHQGCT
ncbi:MAG: metallothionein [Candidatus Eremiobacteraeota bacterium]|nr:metallothionein [Candidatus Eremiobacteraeota bacterium]